jgi:hypothetical protein
MLASQHLAGAPARSYLGGAVRILYAENTGAFLSLGAGAPEWLRRDVLGVFIGLSLLAIGVLAWRSGPRPWRASGSASSGRAGCRTSRTACSTATWSTS